jgi:hypothetical protein
MAEKQFGFLSWREKTIKRPTWRKRDISLIASTPESSIV